MPKPPQGWTSSGRLHRTAVAPNTVIAIDWSGRVDVAGQRRHIVAATWRGGRVQVENGRTRDEVGDWLIVKAAKDPALVVGFDFCFSYPGVVCGGGGCDERF